MLIRMVVFYYISGKKDSNVFYQQLLGSLLVY